MPQRGALSAAPAAYGRLCGLTTIREDFSCRSLGGLSPGLHLGLLPGVAWSRPVLGFGQDARPQWCWKPLRRAQALSFGFGGHPSTPVAVTGRCTKPVWDPC